MLPPSETRPLPELWTSRDLSHVSWSYTLPDFVSALSYSLICLIALVLKNLAVTRFWA